DEVQLIDGLAKALEDVRLLLRAREIVLRPPRDDSTAKADELGQHLLQCDTLRPPADQRQHDDAEGGLHLRVLVELVNDDLRHLPAPQLQHDTDPLAARLVAALAAAL